MNSCKSRMASGAMSKVVTGNESSLPLVCGIEPATTAGDPHRLVLINAKSPRCDVESGHNAPSLAGNGQDERGEEQKKGEHTHASSSLSSPTTSMMGVMKRWPCEPISQDGCLLLDRAQAQVAE